MEKEMKIESYILLILIVIISGCGYRGEETLPAKLIGIWETADARFDGCSFEIMENRVVFSNRHQDFTESNRIIRIEKSEEKDKTLYNIYYENHEGLEYEFSLFYININTRDFITIKNREDIQWTRKNAAKTFTKIRNEQQHFFIPATFIVMGLQS